MEKEEEKREVHFNPADYYYMDKMPLEGWMWEFIRRNPEYMAIYNRFEQLPRSISFSRHEWALASQWLDKKSRGERPEMEGYSEDLLGKCEAIQCILDWKKTLERDFFLRMAEDFIETSWEPELISTVKVNDDQFYGMQIPNRRYIDFSSAFGKPSIIGATSVAFLLGEHVEQRDSLLGERGFDWRYDALIEALTLARPSDTLYVGISLAANKKEVVREIRKLCDKYGRKEEVRRRPAKWKHYLMVYDLFVEGHDYADIGQELYLRLEREDKALANRLAGENSVRRYHEAASELIKGGYKRHLSTEK
jgi:hypothetical protein